MLRQTLSLALLSLCALTTTAHAQQARLEGTVTSSGQPARGVTLAIGSYSVTSNQSGHYAFDYLRPGQYVVLISARGRTQSATVTVTAPSTRRDFQIAGQ